VSMVGAGGKNINFLKHPFIVRLKSGI
jgi:hypothetical protein